MGKIFGRFDSIRSVGNLINVACPICGKKSSFWIKQRISCLYVLGLPFSTKIIESTTKCSICKANLRVDKKTAESFRKWKAVELSAVVLTKTK